MLLVFVLVVFLMLRVLLLLFFFASLSCYVLFSVAWCSYVVCFALVRVGVRGHWLGWECVGHWLGWECVGHWLGWGGGAVVVVGVWAALVKVGGSGQSLRWRGGGG